MASTDPPPFSRAGICLCLGVVALAGVLRWHGFDAGLDLRPRADALEYALGAESLASGQGYTIKVDGDLYPPRYPPGNSWIAAPWVPWLGDGARAVVFSNWLWSTIAVGLLAFAARRALGDRVAVAAGLAMALAPLAISSSGRAMSEGPSQAAACLCLVMGLQALRTGAGWGRLGLVCGLACALRFTHALFLAPVALLCLSRRTDPRVGPGCLRAAGGFVLGLLPLLSAQDTAFGSPLSTGYGWWVPDIYGAGMTFGWDYAVVAPLEGGTGSSNLEVFARSLVGMGDLLAWPAALLALAGAAVGLKRKSTEEQRTAVVLGWGFLLALAVFHLPYFHQEERFLLPALGPLCLVAGLCAGAGPVGRASAAAALVACLPAALDPPQHLTGDLGVLPDGTVTDGSWEVRSLAAAAAVMEDDAVLVARTPSALFERHVRSGSSRILMTVGYDEHRSRVRRFSLRPLREGSPPGWIEDVIVPPLTPARAERARASLAAHMESGRAVYFLTSGVLETLVPQEGTEELFGPAVFEQVLAAFPRQVVVQGQGWDLYRLEPPR